MAELPSPVEVTNTSETIWSEDTGRAQAGVNKAKMIGSVVATKRTHNIKWGILTEAEMISIMQKLTPGFFVFGIGTNLAQAQANAGVFYRSEISGNMLPIGGALYYKDSAVSVIEQ
jgi:hypothetical protein